MKNSITRFLSSEKGRTVLLLALLLLLSIPVFILAFYNYPSSDDFGYSMAAKNALQEGGVLAALDAAWRTSGYFYDNWQGLYTSAFILALQPDIYGCYWLSTFFIVAVIFASVAFFFSSIQKKLLKKPGLAWLNISALVTFFFMMGLPDVCEGLYWFNGAANYLMFVSFSLFVYELLIRAATADARAKRIIMVAGATVASFLVSGGNHVTAFGNILALSAMLVFWLRKRWMYFLPPLIAALGGFFISATSPGTAIRQARIIENIGSQMGFLETLKECFWHAFEMLSQWTTPGLFLLFVVITPFLLHCRPAGFSFKKRYMALSIIIPFLTVWLLYCPILYATHGYGTGRSDDCIFLVFAIESVFPYAYALYGVASSEKSVQAMTAPTLKPKAFLVLLALVCFLVLPLYGHRSTSHQAINELMAGTPQAFAEAQHERRAEIAESEVGDAIMLKPLPDSVLLTGGPTPLDDEVFQYNAYFLPSKWFSEEEAGKTYFNREFYGEETAADEPEAD